MMPALNGKSLHFENSQAPSSDSLQALEHLFSKAKDDQDFLGWVNLPFQTEAFSQSKKWASKVKKSQTELCVLGMGGSQLGAQAVYDFLQPKKKIHFLNNVDGFTFDKILGGLNFKKTHFLAISKSGETSE